MNDETNTEFLATFKSIVWKLSVLAEYLKISEDEMRRRYDAMRQQQSLANDEMRSVLNDISNQLTELLRRVDDDRNHTPILT